jgi:hypothetical protein
MQHCPVLLEFTESKYGTLSGGQREETMRRPEMVLLAANLDACRGGQTREPVFALRCGVLHVTSVGAVDLGVAMKGVGGAGVLCVATLEAPDSWGTAVAPCMVLI